MSSFLFAFNKSNLSKCSSPSLLRRGVVTSAPYRKHYYCWTGAEYKYIDGLVYNYGNSVCENFSGDTKNVLNFSKKGSLS